MKNNKHYFIPVFLFFILFATAFSQTNGTEFDPNATLPADPNVRSGELENGLKYFIRENHKPENRAEFRLVVNAGSVLEDDDQQGLAHFCEHMAFNGTKHFEKQKIIDFMETIGMRFGPEVNAYTNFDETVYMLELPTDSLELMETAFLMLSDWAHLIIFEEDEIDKERGIIVEEWRQGRGAQARMRDKQIPVIFKGSRYASRLPIGQKAVIDTFHHETLRRFYRDWYRPDLMAVVVVGDFDSGWIEEQIKTHFSFIPQNNHIRYREIFPVPDHKEILYAPATDPEATQTGISIYYKYDAESQGKVGDYRRRIVQNLYHAMINQRFYERTKQSVPPFLYGASGQGRFVRSKDVFFLTAGVEEDGLMDGLEALLTEAERIKRYGFTQSELDRMKKEFLRNMEQAYRERDKTYSSIYASEYIRHFLTGEPIPGIEVEYRLYQEVIPGITLNDVNVLSTQWMTEKNRVILVNAPEKKDKKIPNKGDLLSIFDKVGQKEITPYNDQVSEEPLLKEHLPSGDIVEESRISELDVTEWILSNGIKVVSKQTDFKNDEILFSAFSAGGNSHADKENYIAAITAPSLISEGGVGSFSKIELDKKLAGKVVRVSPRISTLTEGFTGSASPRDLETLFQLVTLYATAPRKDSAAFLSYKTRIEGFIENRSASPEAAFQDTISVTLSQYHYRVRPWTVALLEEMDVEKSFSFYRDRFKDTDDFVFIFIGSFNPDTLRYLATTYLAGLPSLPGDESWEDTGMEYPKGIISKTVYKGLEPKSRVNLFFTGDYKWSRENNYTLESMVSALRIKLREVLREDLGGTYGVSIGTSQSLYPKPDYSISIGFGCDPDRVEELTQTVFTLIDSVQQFGLDSTYVQKVKESQLRQYETQLKENGFWLSALYRSCFYQTDPLLILSYKELVDSLSVKSIREAARQYFNSENYVRVVLKPEEALSNSPESP